ncbi:MAG: 8-oxo-dGTP diphosphatase MutT [Verrucomicrobia bacterium]|jgi:mutator protein MutT|nr:8-oxo-dGTP diphosphatase MutT [Verrucomicrobiota bacterium]
MPIKQQKSDACGPNRQSAIGNQQLIEVSAGLIFRGGKLLITQRRADSPLGGLWEFPGGKREAGESFEQCLVRELREELGVDVRVGNLLESIAHEYPERTVRLNFFLCHLERGEPQPIGCPALKWVGRSGLKNHAFPGADSRLLEKLRVATELWGTP